jgi:hypothetical protein
MEFRQDELVTRRYELQLLHHAAYLYWDVRGVLAERWGHGPYFGAYGDKGDAIVLTDLPGDQASLYGVYGLRGSALMSEQSDQSHAPQLAENWLFDCLQVLRPKVVTGDPGTSSTLSGPELRTRARSS